MYCRICNKKHLYSKYLKKPYFLHVGRYYREYSLLFRDETLSKRSSNKLYVCNDSFSSCESIFSYSLVEGMFFVCPSSAIAIMA